MQFVMRFSFKLSAATPEQTHTWSYRSTAHNFDAPDWDEALRSAWKYALSEAEAAGRIASARVRRELSICEVKVTSVKEVTE